MDNQVNSIKLFCKLSGLVHTSEFAKELTYLKFKKNFSPFKYVKKTSEAKTLLIASYFYLSSHPSWYRSTWDWRILWQLIQDRSSEIKWLAMQCIRVLCNLPDKEYFDWMAKNLSDSEAAEFRLKYNFIFCTLKQSNSCFILDSELKSLINNYIVDVYGVKLIKYHDMLTENLTARIVMVPSVEDNLKKTAICVSENRPVLIEGPLGCGKTSLIEHLSQLTGRVKPPELTKIQIGNQIDSKLLIGSYCCTEVIGEFIWKPGPLTEALLKGHWLIFEDIDYASADVLTIILSIIKSRSLSSIPGCYASSSSSTVDPRFRFFFTRRIFNSTSESFNSADKEMLFKLCEKISLSPFNQSELKTVVCTRWPNLIPSIDRILEVYKIVMENIDVSSAQTSNHNPLASKEAKQLLFASVSRQASLRDFLKWCQRIASYIKDQKLSDNQRKACLLDANDCFLANIANPLIRSVKSKAVGVQLQFPEEKTEKFLDDRKPAITELSTGNSEKNSSRIRIGRIELWKNGVKQFSAIELQQPFCSETFSSRCLLEKIAGSVFYREPILLVGETGTGKTSTVQYLCSLVNRKLTVINMNQQSDTCDLLGGYKPVELSRLIEPLKKEFELLFSLTFNEKENIKFLQSVATLWRKNRWANFIDCLLHITSTASRGKSRTLKSKTQQEQGEILQRWSKLANKLTKLKASLKDVPLVFTYVEGTLIKAMRQGEWILLDEINLAESETLQCLSSILESEDENVLLLDKADGEPIRKHPDFRLFACMNPSTDIGKRDLPIGIRNRFTEFFVEELESKADLRTLVSTYLKRVYGDFSRVEKIVEFYLQVRKAAKNDLKDAVGGNPTFTLRTLCRALQVAVNTTFEESSAKRVLYEAFCLSFLTQLNAKSYEQVEKMIIENICNVKVKNIKSITSINLPKPKNADYLLIEGYWIPKGPNEPVTDESYIPTESVKRNLRDVARIVSIGKSFPILIQGETSVGKTSMISYLAKRSGNICLRVNNHEHTDLQEYVGSYTADDKGKLVFKEGVLVEAMRKGYWIILDELNLASTEVLESLNRVLDDNRELFIPETQETIKAHPKFLLFATQNPPGHYGGRKILSRAFRNRFIELHFDEIPSKELKEILEKRCFVPSSYAKKMVDTLMTLRSQLHQSVSLSFAGRHGGVTLRDLFRWGERYRRFSKDFQGEHLFDWKRHLANEGYMLLAGRARNSIEEQVIREVLSKIFGIKNFNPDEVFDNLFSEYFSTSSLPDEFRHIYWTKPLKRLAILVFQSLKYDEPVLLVGETGCGKTTICQLFAAIKGKPLFSINCHMHSESSDFLGSLRPVRNSEANDDRLFEWVDGPLVKAMQIGSMFLVDEISLADDSVLERLNSVIEPERLLLLTEKGFIGKEGGNHSDLVIKAHPEFHLVATMNPGGDYGKKELSPALRNRFTEIWCYSSNSLNDLKSILQHNLKDLPVNLKENIVTCLIKFLEWFLSKIQENGIFFISIRDVISLVNFISTTVKSSNNKSSSILSPSQAIRHAIHLVFLDSMGSSGSFLRTSVCPKKECEAKLDFILSATFGQTATSSEVIKLSSTKNTIGIEPFFISKGQRSISDNNNDMYIFDSPTVASNTQRLLRAMQLPKPILIEGVPGVGKTSLVQSLAKVAGYQVIRINLSEQTDISDLFGADLPVEGSEGQFTWRDGPLLQALKSDSCWVLLDELNLASQSVLEGLNACLDHRGEVYIPELGRSFTVSKERIRLFGCQNPHAQGGDRKGLPKSFLNRFTVIYVESLSSFDLKFIVSNVHSSLPIELVDKMVTFNEKLNQELIINSSFGRRGSPWEFNLRDMFRWCQLVLSDEQYSICDDLVGESMKLLYVNRFRTLEDRQIVISLFESTFGVKLMENAISFNILPDLLQVGSSFLSRSTIHLDSEKWMLLHSQAPSIEALMKCVQMNWMTLIIGSTQSGKTSLVHILSNLIGVTLKNIIVNSEMDTIELLGGFNQKDVLLDIERIESQIQPLIWDYIRQKTISNIKEALTLVKDWTIYSKEAQNVCETQAQFLSRLEKLHSIAEKVISGGNKTAIFEALESLKNYVEQRKSLTSRGSFQWVDSVLIDALREGHWLLIDDTNLCPASVLDRLNGLLEPNGELVLNEQGCINGIVPVIKPHPNFRLFLTMDPKNGELSRAMRNRGVEIALLPTFNSDDIISRMAQLGLTDSSLQQTLLSYHKRSIETSHPTEEQLNGSHLIRLTGQILSRLKAGADNMSILSDYPELMAETVHDEQLTAYLAPEPVYRTLNFILGDVTIANVTWEHSLLLKLPSIQLSSNLYQCDFNYNDLTKVMFYLKLFMSRSTPEDILFRSEIVKKSFSIEIDDSLFMETTNSTLPSLPFSSTSSSHLPKDIRFNRIIWDKLAASLGPIKSVDFQNSLNQLSLRIFNWMLTCIQSYHENKASISLLDHPSDNLVKLSSDQLKLLKCLKPLINNLKTQYDSALLTITSNDEELYNLRANFIWFHDLILLVSSESGSLHDNNIIFERLLVLWAVIYDKLRLNPAIKLNMDSHLFTEFNRLLHIERESALEKFLTKKKLSSALNLYKDEDSATIFTKSLELTRLLTSNHTFCELNCSKRHNLMKIVALYEDLFNETRELSSISSQLNSLETEIRQALSSSSLTECYDEMDKQSYSDLLESFQKPIQMMLQRTSPLNYLSYFWFEANYLKSLEPHSTVTNILPLLCLHPIHTLLVKNLTDNVSLRNEILLYHFMDCQRTLNYGSLYELSKTHAKSNDDSTTNENFSEWEKFGYSFQLSPVFTLITTKTLSSESILGTIDAKKTAISTLQSFISQHFNQLCTAEYFNLPLIHIDLVLELINSVKSTIDDFLLHLDPQLGQLFDRIYHQIYQENRHSTNEIHQSQALILFGALLSHLWAPTMPIDPIQKWSLKLSHYQEELSFLEHELSSFNQMSLIKSGVPMIVTSEHPHVIRALERRKLVIEKIDKLSSRQGFRPTPSQYQDLRHYIRSFLNGTFSLEAIFQLVESIDRHSSSAKLRRSSDSIITLQKSLSNCISHIYNSYPLYANVSDEMLLGLCISSYGLNMASHLILSKTEISSYHIKDGNLLDKLQSLISLPTENPVDRAEQLVNIIRPESFQQLISKTSNGLVKNSNMIYKSTLAELRNGAILNPNDEKILTVLFTVIDCFLQSWLNQEEERKERRAQQENLFQYKTKIHENELPEDVQDEIDMKRKFPSYQAEFKDFLKDSVEEDQYYMDESETHEKSDQKSIIQDADIIEISQLHREILSLLLKQGQDVQMVDVRKPLAFRYAVSSDIIDKFGPILGHRLDSILVESSWIVSQLFKSSTSSYSASRTFDFYRDPRPEELSECYSILEAIKNRIFTDLLPKFPGNPILRELLFIIERIYKFDINSPLAKFVAGLEVLLRSAEVFESTAHREIKLINQLSPVTALVIKWRKMELKAWSCLMDSVHSDIESAQISKYWFHFYSLIHSILANDEDATDEDVKQLLSLLQRFFLESSLGEYRPRLQLVNNFISHQLCTDSARSHLKLFTLLVNIFSFYKQFEASVIEEITKVRQPIEKELKAFVKIMRWNDGNFWSLCSNITKSHRTLHRLTKKYGKALQVPVSSFLRLSSQENDKQSFSWPLISSASSLSFDVTNIFKPIDTSEFQILSRSPELFLKAVKYSRKTKLSTKVFRKSVITVDEKIGDIINGIKELSSLKVPPEIKEKEQYEKQVKSINNRKRQAFSALLKNLNEWGISYKKGVELYNELQVEDILLSCHPFHVSWGIPAISKDLTSIDKYFYASISRYLDFKTSLTSPSDEIKEIRNVFDRMKGIVGFMVNDIIKSKRQIFSELFLINKLKGLLCDVNDNSNADDWRLMPSEHFKKWSNKLMNLVISLKSLLYQAKELPVKSTVSDEIDLSSFFHQILGELEVVQFPSSSKLVILNSYRNQLTLSWSQVNEITSKLMETFKSMVLVPGTVLYSLNQVCSQTIQDYETFQRCSENSPTSSINETKEIHEGSEKLLRSILSHIQSFYKTLHGFRNSDKQGSKIYSDISIDLLGNINLEITQKRAINSLEIINNAVGANNVTFTQLAEDNYVRVHHFLGQYIELTSYLINLNLSSLKTRCKLLYVLLGLFADISKKGFCLPPPWQDENEKVTEKDKLKDITDAGLGEGEGTEDVSNKIDSEDQLDEAIPQGAQKEEDKNDDKDLKDEKDGIEMSEDFDAPDFGPDDMEETKSDDEDDSDDDDSDDELDKKMGDIDEEEGLDDKMWGNDDDEEEEDEEDLDDGGHDGGEDTGEDQMVAKDDNAGVKEKSKGNDKEKNDDEDEEVEEINEQKIDDEYEGEREDPFKQKQNKEENDNRQDAEEFPENMELDQNEEGSEDGEEADDAEDAEDGEKDDNDENDKETENPMEEEEQQTNQLDEEASENKDKDDQEDNKMEDKQSEDKEDEDANKDIDDEENENFSTPDNREIETDQAPPDSGHETESQSNAQVEAFYKDDERNINEGTNEAKAEKEDQKAGSSQAPQDATQSAEGKIQSSAVYEDSQNIKGSTSKPQTKKRGQRSVSETPSKAAKKQRILDSEEKIAEQKTDETDINSELVQHTTDDEKTTKEAVDIAEDSEATKSRPDDHGDEPEPEKDSDKIQPEEMEIEINEKTEPTQVMKPKNSVGTQKQDKTEMQDELNDELKDAEMVDLEGNYQDTASVNRGPESAYYTQLIDDNQDTSGDEQSTWFDRFHEIIEKSSFLGDEEVARLAWNECERAIGPLVYELCQQLQLVLEPMKASKMKGDYRTGKRLNMRKVIEYIASSYKKDKIWLRRTKASKRQYQIILAVDDSSSMLDNESKKMAFESIALLAKSLSLMEAGELGVMSFGESPRLLHSFDEPFTDSAGSKLLSQLNFDQNRTLIAKLLEHVSSYMVQCRSRRSSIGFAISQLLIIISDGRGLFNEGEAEVRKRIRLVQELGIFTVFLVMDSSNNKDSILEISKPIFDPVTSEVKEFEFYMDKFPFPYYIILRDINNMPRVLGEALRKWFEMVVASDR